METNNTSQKNENKKIIIICATIVLVAAMALVGVIVLKNNSNQHIYGDLSGFEMTYEDFTYGMKEDLPTDVQEQVNDLYNEFLEASKNNDEKAIMKIFDELYELDVYDENMVSGAIELTPEELAELDPDGDGVIVFEGDAMPEGFIEEEDN